MTPVDAMALAAGVAVSFRFRPVVGAYPYALPPPSVMLVILVSWSFWMATAGLSAVTAARLVRYRRRPRPAEWVAILATGAGVMAMGPGVPVDVAINLLPSSFTASMATMAAWRWLVAGLMLSLCAAGLGLVRLARAHLAPWATSAALTALACLALAGPIEVVRLHGPDLLAPSRGFGAGNPAIFFWLACQAIAAIPLGLFFGVPAVAAILERARGARWRWSEWVGSATSLMVALPLSSLYLDHFTPGSRWWAAERVMACAWVLGIGLLARLVVLRMGPAWSRWLGDQPGGEGGSNSSDASPASTL